jgi:hypothetical protein
MINSKDITEKGVTEVFLNRIMENEVIQILNGGEWSASHPGLFNPRVRAPGTHWIGSWVGPTSGLDMVAKRKIAIISPPGNCVAHS